MLNIYSAKLHNTLAKFKEGIHALRDKDFNLTQKLLLHHVDS